ncbi:MAG: flagellar biosynthesis protein FlgJ [Proteobacteria bacterium]|nr:flagellar biosynthesis protein FlgJ [Pseudomonadota bacterium]
MTTAAIHAAAVAAARPAASAVIKKMEGVLWYNMLSEMRRSGLDSTTLGAGGDNFQNMFVWDIAQKDFGKYDGGLVSATLRQIGGRAHGNVPLAVADGPSPSVQAAETATTAAVGPEDAVGSGVLLAHATELTRAIWPAVQTAASVLGVSPIGVLAQAALETGWGASKPGNNLFGIKGGADKATMSRSTHEMINGVLVPETAGFRDYASPQACVTDYVRLIQSKFRGAVGQNTVAGFAAALQAGGFATDSNYASKILTIARSPMMAQMLASVQPVAAGTAASQSATPLSD